MEKDSVREFLYYKGNSCTMSRRESVRQKVRKPTTIICHLQESIIHTESQHFLPTAPWFENFASSLMNLPLNFCGSLVNFNICLLKYFNICLLGSQECTVVCLSFHRLYLLVEKGMESRMSMVIFRRQ